MAEFSRLVITGKGQALLAKMIAEGCNIAFTKVSASSAEYTDAQLEELTELSEIRQTSLISKVTRTNEVAIRVEVAFTNTELAEGYYMRALGLYAEDPDEGEILYAVTREVSGNCYMPVYNGVTVSGAYVQLVTTVGNAENVTLEVDSGAYATMGDIKTMEAKLGELSGQLDKYLGGDGTSGDIGFVEGIEADNVIDAINEVFQSGNEKKSKLVENLVAMGIEASTDETWEALLGKIQNISADVIHYLGERNSSDLTNDEYTYNLKELYPDDYMNFTENDFIVGIRENSGVGSQTVREPGSNVYGRADGFSLNVTYDANTGILSITNFAITAYIAKYEDGSIKKCNNPGSNSSVVFAYLIADVTLFKNVVDTTSDTVTAAALLSGCTAHNAAGELITGIMADRRGTTVEAAVVTQDDEYICLSLPEGEACYDAGSGVRALNNDIYNKIIYSAGHTIASKMPAIASTELTVPVGVKTGLLIATGYGYDTTGTAFEVTGDGLKSMQILLYNYYPNPQCGVLCVYKCTLNPSQKITVKFTNQNFASINVSAALVY